MSSDEEVASARGMRPAPLWEPPAAGAGAAAHRGADDRVLRASADLLDLDAPVPQMVEQSVGVLKVFDQSLPE